MRYTPDYAAWGRYARESPELKAELMRRAYLGLAVAQSLAPRRTGLLASSGHIVDDGVGGFHHDRMQLSVVFDVPYAASVTYDRRRQQQVARAYLLAAKAVIEAGS